jgi:hypothetical protein
MLSFTRFNKYNSISKYIITRVVVFSVFIATFFSFFPHKASASISSMIYGLLGEEDKAYDVVNLSIECSGGTYMRQLAHDLGEEAGSGAMCLSIKRISVGEFS